MEIFILINGKIVTPSEIFAGNVFVKNGKIFKISKSTQDLQKFKGEVFDLKGKYILPGLIDCHVHFRTPGQTKKEDWTSGSKAALAGGVTTVLDMPNNNPSIIDKESLEKKREIIEGKSLVNYGFYLGANSENFKDVQKIKNISGVKIYMGGSTGNLLVADKNILEKFFKGKKLLALHAESESCLQEHSQIVKGNSPEIHSKIRDAKCAYEAVKLGLHLAKKYGTKVHFCHTSTGSELKEIRKFKSSGKISVEVTPHHLFLSDQDYSKYGNLIKVNPPVRSLTNQVDLWQGIKDGTVDIIATDHAPHLLEEKMQSYEKVPSGIPGVQTMLPLLLNAVNEGKISLQKVVELTSYNPARIFGIKNKGQIKKGFDADLTVVDLNLTEKVCHDYLWSKANWSPFHKWILQGWPIMTFVNGNLMYEWREKFGKNLGSEVKFVK